MTSAPTRSRLDHDVGPAPEGETGLLVYGITDPDAAGLGETLDELPGLDGRGVTLLAHGPVAVIVERITVVRPPGRRRDLVAFAEVLDSTARVAPVLPIRFGSVLADETEVHESLFPDGPGEYEEALDRVRGRVQVSVSARYVEQTVLAEVVAASPEIAELRRRTRDLPEEASYADRVRLGELVAQEVEARRVVEAEAVLDLVCPQPETESECEIRVRPGAGLEHIVDVAVLVPSAELPALEERLEAAAEAWHERVRLRLVGPTAPYDFVGQRWD